MTFDISDYILIDNHAHSLLRKHTDLDEIGFRRCFTESRSLGMLETHLPHSIHYMDLLDHLERIFNSKTEGEYIEFRSRQSPGEFLRMLWDDVSIGAVILDDGFAPDDFMPIGELAASCGRPVFHCRRIEPLLERCIIDSSDFDQLCASFFHRLTDTSGHALVALKTICGYRGGLAIGSVSRAEAAAEFKAIKQSSPASLRISRSALYHFFLIEAFELAGKHALPVQIHTGLGDDDADLLSCNPALLQPLFRQKRLARTEFVLLHCYPYVREAAFLCALYPNVYMDLSLSISLASPVAPALLSEALALCPTSKILAGTDGHSCPESHWYAAVCWKRGLTHSLFALISASSITQREAEQIASMILHANARRLYKLEGLV